VNTPLRMLWRDAKAGELTLLVMAIVLAVVIVTAISLFAERLQKALVSESRVFLASDLVLSSGEPVEEKLLLGAVTRKVERAEVIQFPSMVFAGEEMFLSSVKAVSDGYPLRGQLEVSDEPFTIGKPVEGGPKPGEAWLDSRLFNLLNIQVGDEVWVGEHPLKASRVLVREPDSGSSFWSLGPRIMFNTADLPKTQVVQEGSRIDYRYLFAGEEEAVQSFSRWVKPQLSRGERLRGLGDEQPGLADALDKAESFLLLAGSLGVLLASVAVAMASRRYSVRHFDAVAVMKTLGATPKNLGNLVLFQLLIIIVIAVLFGWLIGWIVHHGFLAIMKEWLPINLPQAGLEAYWVGAGTGIICTLAFALPLMWQLRTISALRVLRRELGSELRSVYGFYLMGAGAIFFLMYSYSDNLLITSLVFAGTLGCAALVGGLAWLLMRMIKTVGSQAGSIWRLAISNLHRSQWQTIIQLLIFGLAIMLLLVTVLIRTSILKEWELQLPPDTPNHFLINIAEYQVEPLKELLEEHKLKTAGIYPMVRGRIVKINHRDAAEVAKEEVDELHRPLNLTWAETMPEDNELVAGQWWSAGELENTQLGLKEVSIELELAEHLGVQVGDILTFKIAGEEFDVRLGSIRKLAWDRMRPNFFFMFEPGVLEQYSATYITSFFLPKEKKLFLNDVLRAFPTITVFEVDEMIRRIKEVVDQVTQAIELVLGLILLSGALVLVACIQSSLDHRLQENALLRTLGAGRNLIVGSLSVEFVLLGFGAGVMAAFGAELTAWALQTQAFQMDYVFHPWLWFWGPFLGALIIGVLGVWSCRKVVQVAPLIVLRELM